MNWIISIIFLLLGIVFLIFGYNKRLVEITFVGYLFIFALGLGILATGLSIPVGFVIG